MLQAMTTGHDGSLSTGHANSPRDMLRRLETMVLMTGYEMPLRAIREQIASAVDVIVHTARLKDGTRKITSMTEVYGIEDDEILTQEIFAFKQTGVSEDGKIEGALIADRASADVHEPVHAQRRGAAARRVRHPERAGRQADRLAQHQGALGRVLVDRSAGQVGRGPRAGSAGQRGRHGLRVVDRSDRPRDWPSRRRWRSRSTRASACRTSRNSSWRSASSLDRVAWASWSLRDASDFDDFNEEWVQWFPGDSPVGQATLMPPLQRRAGFRVSIGVIAEA